MKNNKIALSSFDDKFYRIDTNIAIPYGYTNSLLFEYFHKLKKYKSI